jgi:hypothetical protein
MKLTIRAASVAVSLLMTGFLATPANAATKLMSVGDFTATPSQTLQIRPKSWNDPAFGDMGWTHHSAWGKFQATAGQTVTIKAVAANTNVHPGVTVWYRGAKDTADDSYVPDHFYAPNSSQFVSGAKDETTGTDLGNIVMKVVKFGFDKDKNKGVIDGIPGLAKKDKVAGQLVLTFKAKQTGTYMFVLGGFNPSPVDVDASVKYDVATEVTLTNP